MKVKSEGEGKVKDDVQGLKFPRCLEVRRHGIIHSDKTYRSEQS